MDEIAEHIDRLDALIDELHAPIPQRLQIRHLREVLPQLAEGLRSGYLAAGGENHWYREHP